MNFRKGPKRGGGHFQSKKFILKIFAIIDDTSVMNFRKKMQYDFPKMKGWGGAGGGGQRPLGIFPKIHPFWHRHPSLTQAIDGGHSAYAERCCEDFIGALFCF